MAFGQLANAGRAGLGGVGRPARSIIGQAIAAHPNWNPHPGGAGSAGGAGLGAGVLSTPQAPAAPAAPAPAPAPAPGGSPLDAQYYQNVAQHLFDTNNRINAYNAQDANNYAALQTALGNLAYQQPRDALALEQRANQGGGLYSSVEGTNQSNLAHTYLGKQTAAQTSYSNSHGRIAAAIAALQAGIPIYDTGQALASSQRASVAAQNNPDAGAVPQTPAPSAPAPAPAAPGSPAQHNIADQQRADQAQTKNRLAQNIARQRRR